MLLALQVRLVANQEGGDFVVGVGACFIQPFGDVIERLSVADIVDQYDSDGAAIVGACNGLESFLSSLIGE